MTREDFYLGHYDGCLVNPIVDKIFASFKLEPEAEYQRGRDDVLNRSCEGCKWKHIPAKDSKENPLFYACFSCSRDMPDKWEQK